MNVSQSSTVLIQNSTGGWLGNRWVQEDLQCPLQLLILDGVVERLQGNGKNRLNFQTNATDMDIIQLPSPGNLMTHDNRRIMAFWEQKRPNSINIDFLPMTPSYSLSGANSSNNASISQTVDRSNDVPSPSASWTSNGQINWLLNNLDIKCTRASKMRLELWEQEIIKSQIWNRDSWEA